MTARRLPGQLGLPGLLGLLLLAGSGWAAWGWLPDQQAEAARLGSEARRLRHELNAKFASGKDAPDGSRMETAEQAWRALWLALPDEQGVVTRQSAVLASAARHGLDVRSVQYGEDDVARQASASAGRAALPAGGVLRRHRMAMPLEGSYAAVRGWLGDVLMQDRSLAIDALDIQREDVGRDRLKVRVAVSLYSRQPQRGAP